MRLLDGFENQQVISLAKRQDRQMGGKRLQKKILVAVVDAVLDVVFQCSVSAVCHSHPTVPHRQVWSE